jgi:predicted DNA repair protein MutK
VGRALANPVLRFALRVVGPTATLAIGFAIPLVAAHLVGGFDLAAWAGAVAGAAAAAGVLRWLAPTLGAVRLGLVAAVVIALGAAW